MLLQVIVLGFSLLQCGMDDGEFSEQNRVLGVDSQLSIVPPLGWTRIGTPATMFRMKSQASGSNSITLQHQKLGDQMAPVKKIAQSLIERNQKNVPYYEILEQQSLVIDGKDANLFYIDRNKGRKVDLKLKQTGTCLIADGANGMYIVTLSVVPEDYEKLKPAFEQSVKTIRISSGK